MRKVPQGEFGPSWRRRWALPASIGRSLSPASSSQGQSSIAAARRTSSNNCLAPTRRFDSIDGKYSGVGRISGVSTIAPNWRCSHLKLASWNSSSSSSIGRRDPNSPNIPLSAAEIFRHAGIMAADVFPGFLGGLAEGEEVEVRGRDHALVDQRLEVDHPLPE